MWTFLGDQSFAYHTTRFLFFFFFFFYKFTYFIYLFLAVLGLRCCTGAFFSRVERGLFFVVVRGLLIAVASLVA